MSLFEYSPLFSILDRTDKQEAAAILNNNLQNLSTYSWPAVEDNFLVNFIILKKTPNFSKKFLFKMGKNKYQKNRLFLLF